MHQEPFRGRPEIVRPTLDAAHARPAAASRVYPSLLNLDDVGPREVSAATAEAPRPVERDGRFLHRMVTDPDVSPHCREQYRRLAACLHQLHGDGLSIVVVASAVNGEGKTLTAVNLALTFSQSYRREVLLIDADLRRPLLHKVFGVSNDDGLNQYLAGTAERNLPVRQVIPWLSLLPAGEATDDPMARLTSARMKRVFGQAPESFDWVIVDTPAMALLPDAGLLASMADGVLLVVNARSTSYATVKRTVETIGRSRIVGIALNRAGSGALAQATEYDRYYSPEKSR